LTPITAAATALVSAPPHQLLRISELWDVSLRGDLPFIAKARDAIQSGMTVYSWW
jgi:hypothetical protein